MGMLGFVHRQFLEEYLINKTNKKMKKSKRNKETDYHLRDCKNSVRYYLTSVYFWIVHFLKRKKTNDIIKLQ